ncbi:MAG: hypothetical protein IJ142_06595, partial [Bacteroidaceae bacterium]|nr:hypothetical protein [Bacteroidaceae bacterium]
IPRSGILAATAAASSSRSLPTRTKSAASRPSGEPSGTAAKPPSLRSTSPDIAPSLHRTSALGTAARMYFAATSSSVRSTTVRGSAKFANRNSSRLHCMG